MSDYLPTKPVILRPSHFKLLCLAGGLAELNATDARDLVLYIGDLHSELLAARGLQSVDILERLAKPYKPNE